MKSPRRSSRRSVLTLLGCCLVLAAAVAIVACSDQTPTSPPSVVTSPDASGSTGSELTQAQGPEAGEEPPAGEDDAENPGSSDAPGQPGEGTLAQEEGRGGGGGRGQPKVDVCHVTGSGNYNLINIAQPAVPAHLRHGDALPFEEVPTQPGMVFDAACVPTVISIDIEKSTAGTDADVAPGPLLVPGEPVDWAYVVTNDGGIDLVNVEVTDDQGVTVSCPADSLAASASMSCTGSGVVVDGQYANIGTATGESTGGFAVVDSDPSHYFGRIPVPGIAIEKATNGVDADTPELGPLLVLNAPVTWTYVITNTGDLPLTDIELLDDDLAVAPSCPATTLDPGESMTCTATGQAIDGPYSNTGIATGSFDPVPNNVVTDSDPSHYTGARAAIQVEKSVNGFDADVAPGPEVQVGDPLAIQYVVSNLGSDTLTDVGVVDGDPAVTVSCPQDTLASGASMTCTGAANAVEGQQSSIGTATGDFGTTTVSDDDPAFYKGVDFTQQNVDIDIEKATNLQDADVTGPTLTVGTTVTWTYVVTNTGDVAFDTLTVVDDDASVSVVCPPEALTLAPGGSVTCTATGTVIEGPYANVGTASGTTAQGATATDSDPSHYEGVVATAPGVTIEKSTNDVDADSAPGPDVFAGDQVIWKYVVTNTGSVPLSPVTVTDDQGVVVTCPTSFLQIGESMTCTGSGLATEGAYANEGMVVATPVGAGTDVTDTDMSHYNGLPAPAQLSIQSLTCDAAGANCADADDPNGPDVPQLTAGDTVVWQYDVENTGTVGLTGLTVIDAENPDLSVSCPPIPGLFGVGATLSCTATGTVAPGTFRGLGRASAIYPATGETIAATDPTHYSAALPLDPAITIEKLTNGVDGDESPGVQVSQGDPLTWTYEVTNTGGVPFIRVLVNDDQLGFVCDGFIDGATPLLPGSSFTCTMSGVASTGTHVNVATVDAWTASSPNVGGPPSDASDTDSSHYTGLPPATIDIEKATCSAAGVCSDADAAPGPTFATGALVSWQYVITNTGEVAIDNIVVTDDQGVAVSCPATSLAPTASMTCTGGGGPNDTADQGQYRNVGSVNGVAVDGRLVVDSDASHYLGTVPESGLVIEKSTNGFDADSAPGPTIAVGNPVTWTYAVTNTGNVPLYVTVTDDQITISNNAGCTLFTHEQLAPGATMTCTQTGTATQGLYTNVGRADGRLAPIGAIEVTDTDASHYTGEVVTPPLIAIDIEKFTNDVDTGNGPGEDIVVGTQITWKYVVTNTGNVALDNVVVTDAALGNPTVCTPGTLAAGQSATCTATGVAVLGPYVNVGVVVGQGTEPDGTVRQVTDSDASHYVGISLESEPASSRD